MIIIIKDENGEHEFIDIDAAMDFLIKEKRKIYKIEEARTR